MDVVRALFGPLRLARRVASPATAARGTADGHDPGLCHVSGSDRKSTRLNSSHRTISYAVFCLKKKKHPVLPGHRADMASLLRGFPVVTSFPSATSRALYPSFFFLPPLVLTLSSEPPHQTPRLD